MELEKSYWILIYFYMAGPGGKIALGYDHDVKGTYRAFFKLGRIDMLHKLLLF